MTSKLDQRATHDQLLKLWETNYPNTVWDGQKWWRYIGTHWQHIPEPLISSEVHRVVVGAKDAGVRPTRSITKSVAGMAEDELYTLPSNFDHNPDYVSCLNGLLYLPTRTLSPHDPKYYITHALNFAYDPLAIAHTWHYYLETTLAPDVTTFLQEFAGYCLTTATKYETAVWLYGQRGAGKSTFIQGLMAMLGGRCGSLGMGDISSRFALADIAGKTLLVATEHPASTHAATATINSLISGEPVRSEQKFEKAIYVIPRAKICWAMNDLPNITSANDGIFRRVHIVEFAARPKSKVVTSLKDQIMQEGAGILNWALEGLERLQARDGFDTPASVTDATRDFQETSDMANVFIVEHYSMGDDLKTKSSDLHSHFVRWRKEHGVNTHYSAVAASAEWQRLGFAKYKSDGVMWWRGLAIKQEYAHLNH